MHDPMSVLENGMTSEFTDPLQEIDVSTYVAQAGFKLSMNLNSDLPSSTYQVLGLQACFTVPS